eukprot:1223298-Amphidinium_carterae.1
MIWERNANRTVTVFACTVYLRAIKHGNGTHSIFRGAAQDALYYNTALSPRLAPNNRLRRLRN